MRRGDRKVGTPVSDLCGCKAATRGVRAANPDRRHPTTPHPGRDQELLAHDTPEQSEADRRTVEKWEKAHGTPDIKGAADEARAKLLMRRE